MIVLVASAGLAGYRWATGASGQSTPIVLEVEDGSTAGEVGEILERRGVIRSALAFRLAAAVNGLDSSLQAGTYDLTTNMPLADVIDALEGGPRIEEISVTIPEGYELDMIARRVEDALGIPADEFQRAARDGDYALPPYLPRNAGTLEGFLFPETYGFPRDVGADQVITRLLSQFETEAKDLPWQRARSLGLTPYEVVIVASIVERETRFAADRAKVAAVIYNRLEQGMPLQIDATVQYALPEDNRRLTYEDYEIDSPYNTYLHAGLPPTPIGSPGLASLRAALEPADEDHLFFVLIDPDTGRHAFADTYEEFLRLKDQAGL